MSVERNRQSKKTTFRESPWYVGNLLRQIDYFGEPIPAFNIKGKDKVTTAFGGIMTLTVMFFTLSYLISKINDIVEKKNPIINENKI